MTNIMASCSVFDSPIGELLLTSDGESLTGLWMGPSAADGSCEGLRQDDAWFEPAREQLTAYFAGDRQEFELPVAFHGTEFQERVWRALVKIPFGETVSYGELAVLIGAPKAARAVGAAVGLNPISIVLPCHRVVGSDGRLTGYGGGLERKKWLLEHEAKRAARRRGRAQNVLF